VTYTLGELAQHVNGTVQGDANCRIENVAPLETAVSGQIAFLSNSRLRKFLAGTKASAVILSEQVLNECPVSAIVVDNPHLAYARIAQLLNPVHRPAAGLHDTTVIDESSEISPSASIGACCVIGSHCRIDENVVIGPGCIIGEHVTISAGTRLVANVTLCDGVSLGKRGIIHPGVVIGADGFGLANDNGEWVKVPQLGTVIIGDDVEIGANTTIDRGALTDTVIEDGVKLDNQIQVAHNVVIGAGTAIAACAGIAGSAHIGKRCTIGGGSGLVGHITIVDDVHITAMSFVTKSIEESGVYSSGTTLQENREWRRNAARFRQLDDMARRLKALEKHIQNITEDS
jgi:UDP-3-O-[3-hydroxymyristoyl] glucosamine N-acyltransferase